MSDDTADLPEDEQVSFSIDSSLLFQLGEELVARSSLALAELVKNAYDADATEVTVKMTKVHAPGGSITVRDNGNGMTLAELRAGWMRIATPGKRKQAYSRRYHRPLTGAKGVGRFAARRLGDHLLVRSIAQVDGGKERLHVEFDWAQDFPQGRDLTGIRVPVQRKKMPDRAHTGVALRISGTRDVWSPDDLAALTRDLASLQSPFPDLVRKLQQELEEQVGGTQEEAAEPDPGFTFRLSVDDEVISESVGSEVSQELLARAVAVLDGEVLEVDAPAASQGEENAGAVGKVARAFYTLTLPRTKLDPVNLLDKEGIYAGLVGVRFRVYMFRFSSENFVDSTLSLQAAQRIGRESGGVRIYLNGFRVFPYGDLGDDWLDLADVAGRNTNYGTLVDPKGTLRSLVQGTGRRAFLQIPKNNQVFGAVMISSRLHPVISVNVSRERLIENDEFSRLKRFVQRGIYWMTLRYNAYLLQEEEAKRRTAPPPPPLPEVVRDLAKTVEENLDIDLDQRRALAAELRSVARRAETEFETHIGELSLLRVLASAGTTLAIMSHQLQTLLAAVTDVRRKLKKLQGDLPDTYHATVESLLQQVSNWENLVRQQTGFLRILLSPDSRKRRQQLLFFDIVDDVHKSLQFYFEEYNVQFENLVPRSLRTPPVFQAELYAVLLNLASNSLKALLGREDRRLGIAARRSKEGFTFQVLDSGKGLAPERREVVFNALETDSIPDPLLGIGTGLGLKVVRDLVAQYGGTAQFVDAPSNWVTAIEVFFPTT